MKDICVIVAAKEASPTIARAVSSALRQPEVAEIIVVDDGSQDDTAEVAQAADDASGRLKVIRLPANVGPAAARNRAIAASRAPLICVLDADDWMMDGRFAKLMAAGEGARQKPVMAAMFEIEGARKMRLEAN